MAMAWENPANDIVRTLTRQARERNTCYRLGFAHGEAIQSYQYWAAANVEGLSEFQQRIRLALVAVTVTMTTWPLLSWYLGCIANATVDAALATSWQTVNALREHGIIRYRPGRFGCSGAMEGTRAGSGVTCSTDRILGDAADCTDVGVQGNGHVEQCKKRP